eukprot:SAG11_NODE_1105_length_5858_cov_3.050009_6_plen_63_part_00
MGLRLTEEWAEMLRCASAPPNCPLGVYHEALSPTTTISILLGLGSARVSTTIYYKYSLRPPL